MQIKDKSSETFCMAFAIMYLTFIRKSAKTCEKTNTKNIHLNFESNCLDLLDVIISLKVCASGEKNGSICSPNWQILLMIFFPTLLKQKQLNHHQ